MRSIVIFMIGFCMITISCKKRIGPKAKFDLIFRDDFNEVGDWQLSSSSNEHGDDTSYVEVKDGELVLYSFSNSQHIDSSSAWARARLNFTDKLKMDYTAYRVRVGFTGGAITGSDGKPSGGQSTQVQIGAHQIGISLGASPGSYVSHLFDETSVTFDVVPSTEKLHVFKGEEGLDITRDFELKNTSNSTYQILFGVSAYTSNLLFGESIDSNEMLIDYIEVSAK